MEIAGYLQYVFFVGGFERCVFAGFCSRGSSDNKKGEWVSVFSD